MLDRVGRGGKMIIVADPSWSTLEYTKELALWIARLMTLVCYDEEEEE